MTTAAESVRSAPTGQAEPAKKKSVTRTYIIFKRVALEESFRSKEALPSSEAWVEVKRVVTSTEKAAIESLGPEAIAEGDSYTATPERYWRPRNPNVETQTKITF